MKVTVVRSGGFAGIERRGEADTATDPVLGELVDRVDLGALRPPAPGADRFMYEIDVGGRTAVVDEAQLSGPLRQLVDRVLSAA
ncbi:protealysin inhibitor emfourin [Actinomadura alba]|uniref:protealysin inhibitor emfourin n=1 Tax=Actinomadura alba TaxID=406431 RepID=UPI001C9BED72|nr:protealysin inhibitor emfourin [Actinomadura alba]